MPAEANMAEHDTALEPEDTAENKLREVHERAMRRFDETAWPQQDLRLQSLEARRFVTIPGAQWEGEWGEQFENSIKVEIDKVSRGVEKIEQDYRANRIVPDFRPDGKKGDEETANTLDGLHRADSYRFKSQQARDNGVFEAITGGFGAYRLTDEWEDESDKDNDALRINPAAIITDADQRVFFGPSELYDKSDAPYAFVLSWWVPESFVDTYGADKQSSFPEGVQWKVRDWFQPETITVAEYYEVEEVSEALWVLTYTLSGEQRRIWSKDLAEGQLDDMRADGWMAKRQTRKRRRVHKYVMSGAEILEDQGHIAGPNIPIVPIYGKRYFVDGQERWQGYVQKRMDPQRLYNSNVSKLAETNSLAPREIPIFAPEQMSPTIADLWARANIDRLPYLLAEPLRNNDGSIAVAAEIGKITPPQLAPVTATLLQIANNDLQEDMQDADEVKANVSAEAMDIAATRVDAKSGIYLDNIRLSIQREGEIYLGKVGEVYVEKGREVETMTEDGGDGLAELKKPLTDSSGRHRIVNDFENGRYKVIASVTEATATRRDKTVKSMLSTAEIAAAGGDNELAQVCVLTATMNQDGEGLDKVQEYARRRLVQLGVEEPTDEEKQAMEEAEANAPPDPLAEVAAAQAEDFRASAAKKAAEVPKIEAEAGLKDAQRIETLVGISMGGGPSAAENARQPRKISVPASLQ